MLWLCARLAHGRKLCLVLLLRDERFAGDVWCFCCCSETKNEPLECAVLFI